MTITGIGGLFFRAKNPDMLNQWYRTHLGIGAGHSADGTETPGDWCWRTAAGPTIFEAFKAETDYFPADKQWMLNLRVVGLDALIEKLRTADIDVITKAEWDQPETGRFARVHDPEGNVIELWEGPAES